MAKTHEDMQTAATADKEAEQATAEEQLAEVSFSENPEKQISSLAASSEPQRMMETSKAADDARSSPLEAKAVDANDDGSVQESHRQCSSPRSAKSEGSPQAEESVDISPEAQEVSTPRSVNSDADA